MCGRAAKKRGDNDFAREKKSEKKRRWDEKEEKNWNEMNGHGQLQCLSTHTRPPE